MQRLLGNTLRICVIGAVASLFAFPDAGAQTTVGAIRGHITGAGDAALADVQVVARDPATNVTHATTTNPSGFYYIGGLRPADYELTVRRLGYAAQTRTFHVGIGQTLDQNFSLAETGVTLTAVQTTASRIETRSSEVATNVSQQQIENLPSPSRNFLDLAQLAPGVTVTEDRIGNFSKTFSAGGQPASAVNLFVDGASFKNDLTQGGIAGQDASRGNPFAQSAIQEYRIITQNFKAEYQKASSAIIVATTKSGTNTLSGDLLAAYQDISMVALDSFQLQDKSNAAPGTYRRPSYARTLSAFNLGGPIIKDKAFFFIDYEGNFQNRNNRVAFPTIPAGFPALDTVNLAQYQGTFSSPFREPLLMGKINYAAGNNSDFELSASNRAEWDIRDFGNNTSYQNAVNYRQNVRVAQVKYTYSPGNWLNEAHVDFSRFQRNPRPNLLGVPARIFQMPAGDAIIGGNFSTQDFRQNRIGLRNDLTYSGLQAKGQHVIKGGVNLDFVQYNILKDNDGTPRFIYRETVGTDTFNYETPYQLFYGTGDPNMKTSNKQVGMYIQDDWSPIKQLTLNLGVRWDFETNMMNKDYVTPQMLRDTLTRYNDSLPVPLDLNRYLSDGSQRKPFYGAFQPRFGFSYAIDQAGFTSVFGGWGLYYDRVMFDIAVDEKLKITHPSYTVNFAPRGVTPTGNQVAWQDSYLTADKATLDALAHSSGQPEAWFIDNDIKVPKSTQFNLGVKHIFGSWIGTLTYMGERATDQVALAWAQFALNPNGSCCQAFNTGAHGFSNFIYSTNGVKTWYDGLTVQLDRPYVRPSPNATGWGGGIWWTHSNRSLQGVDNLGDLFAFPNTLGIPKHPSNDEKNRVVANWIVDMPYLWGIQTSGIATLGGKYKLDVGCPLRFCGADTTGNMRGNGYLAGGFTVPSPRDIGDFPYRNVDVRVRKDFPLHAPNIRMENAKIGVMLDVFNLFNRDNFGCYRVGNRNDADFGTPACVVTDARRYQVGAEYKF